MNPTLPKGFRAAGIAAGIKKNGKADLALIASETDCVAAAVFTTNKMKAAPVIHDQKLIADGNKVRAVVINAGCANACTGEQGLKDCAETAQLVANALSAGATGVGVTESVAPANVFVMSTGVIGVNLPMEKMREGVPAAAKALSEEGLYAAAHAIMTTDTVPKVAGDELQVPRPDKGIGKSARFTGIAKGAGMIHPNMATLLAVVMTDAVVQPDTLKKALDVATRKSFNRISVDGDTSTNDTLLVIANGASGLEPDPLEVEILLTSVCIDLAKQIARDGEGATKFITIEVTGAKDEKQAENVGRTIAKSPLVKTAFYGEDANWGRITCAAGYSGEDVVPEKMSLWFGGVHVFAKGMPTKYVEEEATAAMKPHDVTVKLDLGLGTASATVWTCDFSHEYVTINGKYRT
jgi:glutamate N-acetyltransferase/amino-acid N-acetyltransferase